MTARILPLARTGLAPSRHRLASSKSVWFDEVLQCERGAKLTRLSADQLAPETLSRLTRPAAEICGLCLNIPRIMGVLNVTPDSFSDGGDHVSVQAAVERARRMSLDADILDIGGESTRPGAQEVSVQEEIRRTTTAIEAIRAAGIATPISIDTRKARVAEGALKAGANMVNDVSAFTFDPELADLVAQENVPVCLMHAQGSPENMQNNPRYDDVVFDVMDHLEERIGFALSRGIAASHIITDPGIGFGKTLEHNVSLLKYLAIFHDLGLPILLGVSRKRFIGTIGQAPEAKDRTAGSLAVALHGVAQGVQILRVHDTFETRQALRLHGVISENDQKNEGELW